MNNFNPNNYMSYDNYFTPTWPNNSNPWNMQPRTNKILVTSLDEAIAKSNERNSEMVYFHQSNPSIYVVRVDMNGAKSWAELSYSTGVQDTNAPATKADIAALNTKFEALLSKLNPEPVKKKKKETEVIVDESDG